MIQQLMDVITAHYLSPPKPAKEEDINYMYSMILHVARLLEMVPMTLQPEHQSFFNYYYMVHV